MLFKTTLERICLINFNKETIIKFTDDIEFTILPNHTGNNNYLFHVQNPKGKFVITRIRSQGSGADIPYDAETKTFITNSNYQSYNFEFYVSCNVELKKVGTVSVPYTLQVSSVRMKLLKLFEYFEDTIVLDGFNQMTFKCFIKRVKAGAVEITIKNINGVEIEGSKEDITVQVLDNKDYTKVLTFVFDPTISPNNENQRNGDDPPPYSDVIESTTHQMRGLSFFDCLSDDTYADVTLISSEGVEVPAYRCILAKHSEVFKTAFKNQEKLNAEKNKEKSRLEIKVDDADAKTIKAALGYLYGKAAAIHGCESKVFQFATKYMITELKEACCAYLEKYVNIDNVCEYIQIAYTNNFDALKQKCKEILVENKGAIPAASLKLLPKDILLDVFCG